VQQSSRSNPQIYEEYDDDKLGPGEDDEDDGVDEEECSESGSITPTMPSKHDDVDGLDAAAKLRAARAKMEERLLAEAQAEFDRVYDESRDAFYSAEANAVVRERLVAARTAVQDADGSSGIPDEPETWERVTLFVK
jgi:hypothetical protein